MPPLVPTRCSEERDKNQASNELDSGPPKLRLREPPQDDWSRAAAAAAAISAQDPLPHTLWRWGARLRAAARVPIAATTASSCKTPPRSSQSPSRHALSSVESGSPVGCFFESFYVWFPPGSVISGAK
ncbi:hypothetical protein C8R47DRAFT_1083553 [Mycena vitilis]|nr:hypothetical protein C8R47DRAFT_1083553 [Mycena vitilis]